MKLNLKRVAALHPEENADLITKIDAAGQGINAVPTLQPFRQLVRLDLANNEISSFEGLVASLSLKWLSLAANSITRIPDLALPELQVLNVASNQLSGKVKLGSGVGKLRALILNDNAITKVRGLGKLRELNTVVLKNNSITEFGDTFRGCTTLEKLSLAHNDISDIGDSLTDCSQLAELRIGHNDITALPADLAANSRLKIVDLSGNPIKRPSDIEVLAKLPLLQQLSVKGCPLEAAPDAKEALLELLPLVEILDGRRVRARIRGRLAGAAAAADGSPRTTASQQHVEGAAAAAAKASKQPSGKGSQKRRAADEPSAASAKRQQADAEPGAQPARPAKKLKASPAAAAAPPASHLQSKRQKAAATATSDSDSSGDEAAPNAAGEGRAFVDEILSPQALGNAEAAADVAAGSRKSKHGKGRPSASGVVAVIDAEGQAAANAMKAAKKQHDKRQTAADAKPRRGSDHLQKSAEGKVAKPVRKRQKQRAADAGGKAKSKAAAAQDALTGASVAQLLTSGDGLVATRFGMGATDGGSAWD